MPPSLLQPYDLRERDPGPEVRSARRRAFFAFAAFAAGIWLARDIALPSAVLWFGFAALAAGVAGLSRGVACRVALTVALGLLGVAWGVHRLHGAAGPKISELVGFSDGDRAIATLEGIVLDTPEAVRASTAGLQKFLYREPVVRFPLRARRIVGSAGATWVWERAWVRVRAGEAEKVPDWVRAGASVRVTGIFAPVRGPTNPGQADMRLWAAQEGFAGTLTLSSAALIVPATTEAGWGADVQRSLIAGRAWLRDRARHVLTLATTGGDGAHNAGRADALVRGLILGDSSSGDDADMQGSFARQGLAHILAISGFHLMVMSSLALTLIRLTGDRGWVEPAIVAMLVVGYTLIVPPGSPILRSSAMVLILLLAEALGRRYDRLTLMGWIAVGLLVWRPLDLWSLGFELSVGLTAMLFWAGEAFRDTLFTPSMQGVVRRAPRSVAGAIAGGGMRAGLNATKSALATAAMCWLVALPLVMYRVGVVSPLGIAASVLVTPVIVGVLWVGYVALFVGLFVPSAAESAGRVLGALANASVDLVAWFDRVPWSSVPAPPVSAAWAAAATVVLAMLCRRGRWRDAGAMASLTLVGWWLVAGTFVAGRLSGGVFRVDMLDVGNGSCHLLRSGRDAVLWDAAPMGGGAGAPQARVVAAVRAVGAWRVPTVVVTHPDIDHFGGLVELVRPLGVREVLVCERFADQARDEAGGAASTALNMLRGLGVAVRVVSAGDELTLGSCRLRIVSPARGAGYKLDNDHSLVGLVSIPVVSAASDGLAGERSVEALMTGDIQDDAIAGIGTALHPDIMELPHHGSGRSAAIEWTRSLNPRVVLQSTGPRRADDPRWDAAREGRVWLCTARDGAAWASVARDGTITAGRVAYSPGRHGH